MKDKAKLEDEKAKKEEEEKDVKGVPDFWLTIFKNVDMLQEMVQEADEPVLEKLQDITVTFSEKPMVSNIFTALLSVKQTLALKNPTFYVNLLLFFQGVKNCNDLDLNEFLKYQNVSVRNRLEKSAEKFDLSKKKSCKSESIFPLVR